MSKYFRFNSYVQFVEGFDGLCLYNLMTGDIIGIDEEEKLSLIRRCENGSDLSEITKNQLEFLNTLSNLQCGSFFQTPLHVEKMTYGISEEINEAYSGKYSIGKLVIGTGSECNLDCVFCAKEDIPLCRKTGCWRWNEKETIHDLEFWKDVINQAKNLSCRQINFIGGEPLLRFDFLKQLIPYINDVGIKNINILTNGSLLNKEIVKFLKHYNVSLAVQILSNNYEVAESLTNKEGISNTVNTNLHMLDKFDIKYNLLLLIHRYNEQDIEAICNSHKGRSLSFDFLYPVKGSKLHSTLYLDNLLNKRSNLNRIRLENYFYLKRYHNCFGDSLAIAADGDVFPCIMMRESVLGNVKQNSIVDIMSTSDYKTYVQLTKSKIEKCKDCSVRYGCSDCRAIEYYSTGDIYGMKFCNTVM